MLLAEMNEQFRVRWGLRGREDKAPIRAFRPLHFISSCLLLTTSGRQVCPPEGYPGPEMDRTLKLRQTSRKPQGTEQLRGQWEGPQPLPAAWPALTFLLSE